MLEFSSHARRRMRRWHITEEEVIEVLADREAARPSLSVPGRTVVMGFTVGGRRLKVVLVEGENVVVTVAEQGRRR